jgi:Fur family ferric uptake transcriptional regulator
MQVMPDDATRDAAQRLRAAGLRVTRPRLTVLEVCAEHPHAPADLVVREAGSRLGALACRARTRSSPR